MGQSCLEREWLTSMASKHKDKHSCGCFIGLDMIKLDDF